MPIDADLDGGSIEVVDDQDPRYVSLALRGDNAADFKQWFHFRRTELAGEPWVFRIVNAGEATYADAWEGYRVCASYDRDSWFRVDTAVEGGTVVVRHTPSEPVVYYAYYAAYGAERHARLLDAARESPRARVIEMGESVEGRPMSLIVVGDEDDEELPRVWVIARQHPGEAMAEWFMEGLVLRLLDEADELSGELLDRAVFYLVPRMNPDGAARGNHRTNAAGQDLNRAWLTADEDQSPEVLAVREAMITTGVDLFLDVHGDEHEPYVFAAGCEGNPGYSERIARLEDRFMESLADFDPDFQREHGYDLEEPGQADLRIAANYVGERFDCLSLTLEMPFKDDANHPDPAVGWSPERCAGFGRHVLESVLVCVDDLR